MARETIASMAVNIGLDLSEFTKNANEFNKSFKQLGGQMQDVGGKIAVGFGGAALAVGAGLASAVTKAADFEAQMDKVGAISGASAKEMEALNKTALDLGASTSKSASEVAEGMSNMAAMGFTANEVIGAMPGVIAAAEASGSDMAQTADVMASTLNIFGLEAGEAARVADVLAKTANISAANLTDMQYALKYAGPPAAALGVSLEETSAAIGIMVNAGMQGEQAGTTLRSALLSLLSPSDANAEAMENMGIAVTDAAGNFVGLGPLIGNIQKSMEGMTDTQKAATLAQLVGKEAVSGMLSLMAAGPEEIGKMTAALEQSGGASATAAAAMKDNLKGSMDALSGAVETLQISMGTALAPAIRWVADALGGLVNWFNNLPGPVQKWIAIGAAVIAGLLALTAVVGALVVALGFLIAAEWAVILPIIGIVAAVVAVMAVIIALAVLIYKYWDQIAAATATAWEAVKNALTVAWDAIVAVFKKAWETIKPVVTAGWEAIKAYFTAALTTIKTILSAAWEAIKTIFATAFLAIYYVVTGQWDKIGGLFSAAGEKLRGIVSGAWDKIKAVWTAAFEVIGQKASQAWEAMKQIFANAWAGIKSWFSNVVSDAKEMGKNIVSGMIEGVKAMAANLASAAADVVKGAVDAAKNFLGINSPSRVFMEIGGYTGEGLEIGLSKSAAGVAKAAAGLGMASVGSYQGSLSAPNTSPSAVSATDQGTGQDIIIKLDGREIARSNAKYMGLAFRGMGAVT